MSDTKTITFKGTRDIYGGEMMFREDVIKKIKEVFQIFGFEPLETPIIERRETLYGKYGKEAENLLFLLEKPHEDGGLRYDHTVPLARFAANNWNRLTMPYKRYAIGPVFRAENTQAGRFRQFYQCDFDTLGSSSNLVDAEIVAVNYEVLKSLGFKDEFLIYINDRKLLNEMANEMGFTDNSQKSALFRAWDKLDKMKAEEVFEYLVKEMDGLGVKKEDYAENYTKTTAKLIEVSEISGTGQFDLLRSVFSKSETLNQIGQLEQLFNRINAIGVDLKYYKINPVLARGLGYYTGPIFETVISKASIGSISGGGRYDNLIEQMGGPSVYASGSSFGLDRLIFVMDQLNISQHTNLSSQVFVAVFDPNIENTTLKSLEIAKELRQKSISTEIYFGESERIGRQIEVASKKNIPFMVIVGPSEIEEGLVTVKKLFDREEVKVPSSEIISYLESEIKKA